jgi:aerobic-type carbon monoxide dehydrogenase small subunit (CoxS/CutS family)
MNQPRDDGEQALTFTLNGAPVAVNVTPGARLVDVLRETGRAPSVREGCGEGACGTCTVLLDGQPVVACLMLAQSAEGQGVTTLEGLEKDAAAPLLEALGRRDATGCGACLPGLVVNAVALLQSVSYPTAAQCRDALSGVTCRCQSFERVVEAVMEASTQVQRRNGEPTENLPAALVAMALATDETP